MIWIAVAGLVVVAMVAALVLASWRPGKIGLIEGHLRSCPDSPNCVASGESGPRAVEPWTYEGPREAAFDRLVALLETHPRCGRVRADLDTGYIHAEFTTRWLRFVDDVEFLVAPHNQSVIQMRSASRVGYSDGGANARRLAELRSRWDGSR